MIDVASTQKTTDKTQTTNHNHRGGEGTYAGRVMPRPRPRPAMAILVGVQCSGGWKKEARLACGRDASMPVWPVLVEGTKAWISNETMA